MKKINRFLFLGGVFFAPAVMLVFLFPNVAFAATAEQVVISQIQIDGIDGSGGTDQDFVELYNPTGQAIDLSGWKLRKKTSTGTESSVRVIPNGKTIPAYGYFLWANSGDGYADGLGADESSSANISQNNSIALKDSEDNLIDAVAWGIEHTDPYIEGTAFSDEVTGGQSLERKPGSGQGNGQDTDNNSADFFVQTSPHPRNSSSPAEQPDSIEEEESEEEAGDSSSSAEDMGDTSPQTPKNDKELSQPDPLIKITEIMPNPTGSDRGSEWIELYNDSDFQADISDWYLDDVGTFLPSEKAYKIPEGALIGPKQYAAFLLPSGSIILNNDGDTIRLFNADRSFLEQVSYDNTGREGESYIRNLINLWEWSDNPTPNEPNLRSSSKVIEDDLAPDSEIEKNSAEDEYKDVNVKFNEIMGNAKGADSGNEWVEFVNLGKDKADLTGWYLDDVEDKLSKKYYRFPSGSVIEAGDYLVVRLKREFTITNTGEILSLFSPDKKLRVQVIIPEFLEEDYTFARLTDSSKWDFSAIPTPGGENQFESPKKQIYFSEIFLGASDKEGFIEIYNQEDEWIELSGWKIARGDSFYTFPKGASIPAQSYLAVPTHQIRFAVNMENFGQLKILSPDGQIQSSLEDIEFPKSLSKTQSVALENGRAVLTAQQTPYQPNRIAEKVSVKSDMEEIAVIDTRTLPGKRAEVLSAIEQNRQPIEEDEELVAGQNITQEQDSIAISSEEDLPIIIEKERDGFLSKIKRFFCSFRFPLLKCL